MAVAASGGMHLRSNDLLEDLKVIVRIKRRPSAEELDNQNTERPPVGAHVVPAAKDDLGREVFGRAAQRPRALAAIDNLGEAKVDHLDVALGIEKKVLGLEVSVDDVVFMQVLERDGDARRVEARALLREWALLVEIIEELAAEDELEEEV